MRSFALVVMEPESGWPKPIIGAGFDVMAVGPPTSESHEALLQRARDRIEGEGHRLELAVLACNSNVNRRATRRREVVARALLRGLLHARPGHLIISASAQAVWELRRQLLVLTATLIETLGGSSAPVSLWFGCDA